MCKAEPHERNLNQAKLFRKHLQRGSNCRHKSDWGATEKVCKIKRKWAQDRTLRNTNI